MQRRNEKTELNMTMENAGHQETDPAAATVQPPVVESVQNPSRRRFNHAGVGASALVMTLGSRSVLAADAICKSPSGFESMRPAASMNANEVNSCAGIAPSAWLQRNDWPVSKDGSFIASFGSANPSVYAIPPTPATTTAAASNNAATKPAQNNGNAFGLGKTNSTAASTGSNPEGVLLKDATLVQALGGSATPTTVKNLIAAWLNALQRYNTFPTSDQAVRIYQELLQKGYYEPTAGVKWPEAKINEYLASVGSTG